MPLFQAVCCPCLWAGFGWSRWELAGCPLGAVCIPKLSAATGSLCSYLKASQGRGWGGSSSSRKSCLMGKAESSRRHMPLDGSLSRGERYSFPWEEAPPGKAWKGKAQSGSTSGEKRKEFWQLGNKASLGRTAKGDNRDVYESNQATVFLQEKK